jgi:hypothetical protein
MSQKGRIDLLDSDGFFNMRPEMEKNPRFGTLESLWGRCNYLYLARQQNILII